MKQNKRICPFCMKEIIDQHGNRRYHEKCAWEVKLERSKNQYSSKSLEVDSCWKNEKILRDLYYYKQGNEEIDPEMMEEAGFDFDLHNSIIERNGHKVFVMKQFGFSLLKNKKIVLWKI